MISRLVGTIIEKQAPELLLDVSGVGYEVLMPMNSFFELPDIGQMVTIFTHFSVREDAHTLFGFSTKPERQLFRDLIKANGVGPKMALAILSAMSGDAFVECVLAEDTTTLVKIPGVGKKTAERLVIELRDRLKNWHSTSATAVSNDSPLQRIEGSPALSHNNVDDAIEALIALGYSAVQATKAVKRVNEDGKTSEALIKDALKSMI